ncbi:MAG: ABC transporter ATP-binding protein [Promethearchaeota archaeon]
MVWFGLNSEDYDRKYTDKELIKRIFPYFKPFRKKLITVSICLLFSAILHSIVPFVGDIIIKYGENLTLLIIFLIGLFLLTGFTYLLNYIQWSRSSEMVGNLILNLQKDSHKAAINQDMSFFDKYPVGKLLSRINSDTSSFADMAMILMESLSSLLVVVIIFIPMFIFNWILALIVLGSFPLVFLTAMSFRKAARKRSLEGQRALSNVNAFVNESMSGIQVMKTFRQEKKMYDQFNEVNAQSYKVNFRRALLLNFLFPTMTLIQGLIVAGVVFAGGKIDSGNLYLFIQSIWLLFFPLFSISAFWPQFQSGLSAAERLFSLIDSERQVNQTGEEICTIQDGTINIKELTFAYKEGVNVFDNFSLDITPGESIAIVGHTGAGKSSLAKILGRLYEFQEGEILMDGVNIRDMELKCLREQIGFIPQIPFLWAESLEQNVKFGKLDATKEEVMEALELAGGSDWVDDLPKGLETDVGERGKVLSMGQRQLVAFARVLLKDPRIFVLDEATASVDPFTETRIQEALEKTLQGRTSIIIAHRLWTVRNVNRIIVLDQGKIVEEGSHDVLMEKGGKYAELYNTYFKHESLQYIEESGKDKVRVD